MKQEKVFQRSFLNICRWWKAFPGFYWMNSKTTKKNIWRLQESYNKYIRRASVQLKNSDLKVATSGWNKMKYFSIYKYLCCILRFLQYFPYQTKDSHLEFLISDFWEFYLKKTHHLLKSDPWRPWLRIKPKRFKIAKNFLYEDFLYYRLILEQH